MVEEGAWSRIHPDEYTDLLFIHHFEQYTTRKRHSRSAEYLREDINTNQSFSSKNIEDIFKQRGKSVDLGKVILIEGIAGIGKTILCKEIAYRWSCKNLIESDQLVLLVFLRDPATQKINSVEDLVHHFYSSCTSCSSISSRIIDTEGINVTIILDGFDEMSHAKNENTFFRCLLRKEILPVCRIVVTSRPTASDIAMLQDMADVRIEIFGFTKESGQTFIDKGLKNDAYKKDKLKGYLNKNKNIFNLCYIPFILSILVCIAKEYDKLPSSRTDVYNKFIIYTVSKFLQRLGHLSEPVSQVNKLPSQFYEHFLELCKYAYNTLQNNVSVFTANEIKKVFPKFVTGSWTGMGLLNSAQYFSFEVIDNCTTYIFLHDSIQEYLAAYYISTLSTNEQHGILKKYFFNERFLNMWIVYTGLCQKHLALMRLLSGKGIVSNSFLFVKNKISDTILQSKIKCLYLFQCLPEIKKDSNLHWHISSLFEHGGLRIDLSDHRLLKKDINMLVYILDNSSTAHWKELNLSHCDIDDHRCQQLCEDLKPVTTDNRQVTFNKINLSNNQLTKHSFHKIVDILIYCKTKQLNLSTNVHIFDNELALHLVMEVILKETLKIFPLTIQTDNQEYLFLKHQDRQGIVSQLNVRNSITAAYLIKCGIDKEVTTALAKASLSKLCVWDCHMPESITSDFWLMMLEESFKKEKFFCVHTKSYLGDVTLNIDFINKNYGLFTFVLMNDTTLIMHNIDNLHFEQMVLSDQSLTQSNKLKEIQICSCININAGVLKSLLEQCSVIVKFLLSDNNIELHLLKQIISMIKNRSSLQEICIRDNNLTDKDCCTIADELNFSNAHSLVMFYNNHLKYYRNYKQSNIETTILQLQNHQPFVIYEKNAFSNTSNICAKLSISNICLYNTVLSCTKINEILISHIISFQSLDMISLTEIHFTDCIIKNVMIINSLFQKLMECKQLTTFTYSNSITNISDVLKLFICDLITLPLMRKLHVYETNLKSEDIDEMSKKLYNFPKLEVLISNSKLVMKNGCDIENFEETEFTTTTNATILWLQCCKINLPTSSKRKHYSELRISNSVIDFDRMEQVDCIATSIETLDISHNQISKCALKAITFIISNDTALCKLYLINNTIQLRPTEVPDGASFSEELHQYIDNVSQQAADDLAAALAKKSYLQTLWLNENYLAPSIEVVVNALTEISGLTELNLNGNISGSQTISSKLVGLITKSKSLQGLYLNDLNLKTNGAIKIAESLSSISELKILDFQNNIITKEAAEKIASAVSNNIALEQLYLGGNHLQLGITKIFKALKGISSLKVLDLENNILSGKIAKELAAVITANNSLKRLWLDNNNLGSSITKIVKACNKNSNFQQLCIANNGISVKVAKDIAAIISNNFTITYLSISDNNLQSSGFTSICNALKSTPLINPLKFLHACSVNVTVTAEVTEAVEKVVNSNQLLEEISIGDNLFKSSLINIVKSCSKLTNLKLLELTHNCISPQRVTDLASSVSECKSLESLSLGGICLGVIQNIHLNVRILHGHICTVKEKGNRLVNDQQSYMTIGFACYEILKMKMIRDLMVNYEWIYLSYIYECVYISYQMEDIINKITKNRAKYDVVVQQAKQNLSQIDSKTMMSLLSITETLKAVNLENNNIDEDAATKLAEHLKLNNLLEQLWLRGNELHDKGASVVLHSLHNLSTLLILDLSYNHLTGESADGIAVMIGNSCSLQQLWLDGNNLRTRGVVMIASALKKLSSLRILSLCSNGITDDAAEDLSDVITSNVLLVDLLLGNNQLQMIGVSKIAMALRKVSMLRKLDLFNNRITSDAAEELGATLVNCSNLQQLYLSNNKFGNKGTIKIVNALKCISRLQVLTLGNNNITERIADKFTYFLKNSISLKILLIGGNSLRSSGVELILQAAKNNTALQLLDVSDNIISEVEKGNFKTTFVNNNNFTIIL